MTDPDAIVGTADGLLDAARGNGAMPELDLLLERAEPGEARPSEAVDVDLRDPAYYINRELSQVAFNARVLEEAVDPANPLLERVKFLAIVESNTDEFYMVRVAGLKQQVAAGVVAATPDGMTALEQLAAVRKAAHELQRGVREAWRGLRPELEAEGIHVLDYEELSSKQRSSAERTFDEMIHPVLTPLAFDPSRPFPHISNLSLNLAVVVRDSRGTLRFARLKVPASLPRLVPLKRSSGGVRKDGTIPHNHYFVWLEQLIAAHLDRLFRGMEIVESHAFRLTRDADTAIQDIEADDLLERIEETVRERRFANVVRLEVAPDMSEEILELLVAELRMDPLDVNVLDAPLGMRDLFALHGVDRHDLKDPPFTPFVPQAVDLTGSRFFEAIRRQDILLHHPYDSFSPVVEFLRSAARDPEVLAIKQTLYRVGRNSPVVGAMLDAREDGKQVAVLVELKARFDEESNIEWAKRLEAEGVHVIYGLLGLKTHAKIALVVRKEGDAIRRYVHMGTGNYNHVTAHLYTDLGMFTCDPDIGADASDLFNYLTGYSTEHDFRKLLVAPINLRSRFEGMIRREIELAEAGHPARLIFKVNSLVDPRIIALLYEASRAGVRVDLVVRGICCLRPGLPGVSDNIRVTSIVGRYLEHSRIYYFENGGQPEVYVGSADLMPRNIDRRVEVLFPIEDAAMIEQLRREVLDVHLVDNVKARELRYNGGYARVRPEADEPELSSQEWFMQSRRAAAKRETASRYRL